MTELYPLMLRRFSSTSAFIAEQEQHSPGLPSRNEIQHNLKLQKSGEQKTYLGRPFCCRRALLPSAARAQRSLIEHLEWSHLHKSLYDLYGLQGF